MEFKNWDLLRGKEIHTTQAVKVRLSRKCYLYLNQPLSIRIASNDHGVPQGVHLGAAAVHGPGQP